MQNDHPFWEVAHTADHHVRAGRTIYQKFTCERCRSRQTIDVANAFHKLGKCEECGHITNIERTGCNYMLIASSARDL